MCGCLVAEVTRLAAGCMQQSTLNSCLPPTSPSHAPRLAVIKRQNVYHSTQTDAATPQTIFLASATRTHSARFTRYGPACAAGTSIERHHAWMLCTLLLAMNCPAHFSSGTAQIVPAPHAQPLCDAHHPVAPPACLTAVVEGMQALMHACVCCRKLALVSVTRNVSSRTCPRS